MNILESGEMMNDYAAFRPVGPASFEETIEAISTAMRFCAERHIRRVVVNTTGLVGIEVPTLSRRYFMAQQFAQAAAPGMKLVLVAQPALIDPEKFGVTAAANAGLRANIFPTESEAVAWLLAAPAVRTESPRANPPIGSAAKAGAGS
jgi:hypothetical protein